MRRILGLGKAAKFVAWVLAFAFLHVGFGAETIIAFELLGDHLSLPHDPKMGVEGVSADGSVVVGWFNEKSPSDPWGAFRWIDGTMTFLEDLPAEGDWGSSANSVSADGSVVVGVGAPEAKEEAFRWENGVTTGLGFLSGHSRSAAYGVSADGSIIVGESGNGEYIWQNGANEAFRWKDGVMTGLGFLPGAANSCALAASADGSVIVGVSGNAAFRWEDGVMSGLGDMPDGVLFSAAHAVSADGSVVVGYYNAEPDGNDWAQDSNGAFRWENGVLNDLGSGSSALGVSADGSVVVGVVFDGPHGIAFYQGEAVAWFKAKGWEKVLLQDFLGNEGIDLYGFDLGPAAAISSDGTTIVGFAEDHAGQQAYRIRLVDPSFEPLIGGTPIEGLPGWFLSDWFGYYSTTHAPWIYHAEHGFIYRHPESTNESMFVYDDAMGAWCWASQSNYPLIYVFDPPADNGGTDIEAEWLWYFEGTKTPRSFGVVTGAHAGEFLFFGP